MGAAVTSTEDLVKLLRSHRFHFKNESDLQDGIEQVLKKAGVVYEREKRLGDVGIIDFLVDGRMGIEVKIKGSPSAVARQVLDYLEARAVEEIVVVSTRVFAARYLKSPGLSEKKITVVDLWECFLA